MTILLSNCALQRNSNDSTAISLTTVLIIKSIQNYVKLQTLDSESCFCFGFISEGIKGLWLEWWVHALIVKIACYKFPLKRLCHKIVRLPSKSGIEPWAPFTKMF